MRQGARSARRVSPSRARRSRLYDDGAHFAFHMTPPRAKISAAIFRTLLKIFRLHRDTTSRRAVVPEKDSEPRDGRAAAMRIAIALMLISNAKISVTDFLFLL